jgi:hypothetical protein
MTVHSAEGKAATDIIQANIDRFKLLLTTETCNGKTRFILPKGRLLRISRNCRDGITLACRAHHRLLGKPHGEYAILEACFDLSMQFVRPPVSTLCVGQAASMGSLPWRWLRQLVQGKEQARRDCRTERAVDPPRPSPHGKDRTRNARHCPAYCRSRVEPLTGKAHPHL